MVLNIHQSYEHYATRRLTHVSTVTDSTTRIHQCNITCAPFASQDSIIVLRHPAPEHLVAAAYVV